MKRRTKKEMLLVQDECRHFLMFNGFNAHKAYDAYIKNYLMSGISLPYYIEGIKDFIKFAKIMKVEQEQKERNKQRELEQKEHDQNTIDKILNLNYDDVITAYKQAKEINNDRHKMVLCDISTLLYHKELKEKFITGYYIDVCKEYNLV